MILIMRKSTVNIMLAILLIVSSLAQAESSDSLLPPTSQNGDTSDTISIKDSIRLSNHLPHVTNHIRRNMQEHHIAAMRDIRNRGSLNQKQARLN